jgi:hypothetical protein
VIDHTLSSAVVLCGPQGPRLGLVAPEGLGVSVTCLCPTGPVAAEPLGNQTYTCPTGCTGARLEAWAPLGLPRAERLIPLACPTGAEQASTPARGTGATG